LQSRQTLSLRNSGNCQLVPVPNRVCHPRTSRFRPDPCRLALSTTNERKCRNREIREPREKIISRREDPVGANHDSPAHLSCHSCEACPRPDRGAGIQSLYHEVHEDHEELHEGFNQQLTIIRRLRRFSQIHNWKPIISRRDAKTQRIEGEQRNVGREDLPNPHSAIRASRPASSSLPIINHP
jgi:hypothetical protein